jgi:hypothetical protein
MNSCWLEGVSRRSVFIIYSASGSLMLKEENKGSQLCMLLVVYLVLMGWCSLDKSQLETYWEFVWYFKARVQLQWLVSNGRLITDNILQITWKEEARRGRKETSKTSGGVSCRFWLGTSKIMWRAYWKPEYRSRIQASIASQRLGERTCIPRYYKNRRQLLRNSSTYYGSLFHCWKPITAVTNCRLHSNDFLKEK